MGGVGKICFTSLENQERKIQIFPPLPLPKTPGNSLSLFLFNKKMMVDLVSVFLWGESDRELKEIKAIGGICRPYKTQPPHT